MAASRASSGRRSAASRRRRSSGSANRSARRPASPRCRRCRSTRSGADASLAGGGVRLNYIPRDGGNTFKGLLFFTGANSSMQATNYTTIADDPVTQPPGPRPADAARRGRQDLRFQSRLRRPAEEGQAVVVRHGAMDGRQEHRHAELPEQELPGRPRQSVRAQQHDAHLQPGYRRAAARELGAATSRNRRCASPGRSTRRTRSARTTTTRSASPA